MKQVKTSFAMDKSIETYLADRAARMHQTRSIIIEAMIIASMPLSDDQIFDLLAQASRVKQGLGGQ